MLDEGIIETILLVLFLIFMTFDCAASSRREAACHEKNGTYLEDRCFKVEAIPLDGNTP